MIGAAVSHNLMEFKLDALASGYTVNLVANLWVGMTVAIGAYLSISRIFWQEGSAITLAGAILLGAICILLIRPLAASLGTLVARDARRVVFRATSMNVPYLGKKYSGDSKRREIPYEDVKEVRVLSLKAGAKRGKDQIKLEIALSDGKLAVVRGLPRRGELVATLGEHLGATRITEVS